MTRLAEMTVEEASIHTIRTLAMDAVQRASSGHPGTPMALAPVAYLLYREILDHDPGTPDWFDRDRFVLSNGHASMLQYAALHLTGYDLSLEDLKNFRQWGSPTAGHPEQGHCPGIETTTGPLGQGFMTAVGMAMAEAHLAARYNRPDHEICDHRTWVICSDGDLMEGASHEAASIAGHFGLGKLIAIYDDNHITIEGTTELTYSDDVRSRFEGYGWHVRDIGDAAEDLDALRDAFREAREETDRPSLVVVRSHIGYGAPNKQDTPEAHGAPLGEDEVRRTKEAYGWPAEETFLVPDRVREHMDRRARGRELAEAWNERVEAWAEAHPDLHEEFRRAVDDDPPTGWEADLPAFEPGDGPLATRDASGAALRAIAPAMPWLMGGSADLGPSNRTVLETSDYFNRGAHGERNVAWGIREHLMAAASTGMALHGGVRPYAATFFIFTDYARPAIRLACLMEQPVVYVMTHDSIGLGEDGPTHQPVEHLASFRAMPGMVLIRPADANEAVEAWRAAIERREGPTMLVLTRQKLPVIDRGERGGAEGLHRGAYVLEAESGSTPDAVILASGSEVNVALGAREELRTDGVDARVVSMPSWELFRAQEPAYRDEVLPPDVGVRVAVEAGSPVGWHEWVGERGGIVGVDRFGASAPWEVNFEKYGLTPGRVAETTRGLLEGSDGGRG